MNMKTIKNTITVGALAFLFGITTNAMALTMFPIEDAHTVYVVNHVQTKTVVDPTPTSTNAPITTTNTTKKVVTTTTAKNTTVPASSNISNTTMSNLPPVVYDQGASSLTALSIRGSGGFMPSSIWQWLLVIFLILVIIIIARMLTRPTHHHEVHTVTAH